MYASGAISSIGDRYVDRGNIDAHDFEVGAFTADGAWHDLDLSGIVPINVKLIHVVISLLSETHGLSMKIKNKDNTHDINITGVGCTYESHSEWGDAFVTCDSNRKIMYVIDAGVFTTIHFTIRGWFV